jgi:hypothetical protein
MTPSQTPETPNPPAATEDGPRVDLSRRRLAGVGASAIFTLASRPVLAVQCNSPSAAASGNLSHHGMAPQCTGRTPAQWVASVPNNNINNGFPGGNVEFNDVFANGGGINWPNGQNGRLYRVMSAPNNANADPQPNPISAEFAATLLNIRDGRIPNSILTEVALIHMWNEWRDTNAFVPKLGGSWNDTHIVNYLRSLQGI